MMAALFVAETVRIVSLALASGRARDEHGKDKPAADASDPERGT